MFQQAVLNIWREHIMTNSVMYEVILAVLFRDPQKIKILAAFRKIHTF